MSKFKVILYACLLTLAWAGTGWADFASDELIKKGVALHDQGKYDEAISIYQQVLKTDPHNPVALYEMSYSYYAKRDLKHSLEAATEGAGLKSGYTAQFYETMGNCYDDMNQSDKAIAAYKQGVLLDPKNERLQYNLALAYANAGQEKSALGILKRCAVLNPQHASAQLLLGKIFARQGYRVPSVLAFCRFLTLEPATTRSQEALEWLNQLLQSGASKDPKNGNVNITLEDESKSGEGDFSALELLLSISSDTSLGDSKGKLSTSQWRLMKFTALFQGLGAPEHAKDGHFAYSYYRPYFADLEKKGLAEPFCYFIYQSGEDPEVLKWLEDNPGAVKKFAAWSENFKFGN